MKEKEEDKKEVRKIIILVFIVLFSILAAYLIGLKLVMFGLYKAKTKLVEKQLENFEPIPVNKNATIDDLLHSARDFVNQNET